MAHVADAPTRAAKIFILSIVAEPLAQSSVKSGATPAGGAPALLQLATCSPRFRFYLWAKGIPCPFQGNGAIVQRAFIFNPKSLLLLFMPRIVSLCFLFFVTVCTLWSAPATPVLDPTPPPAAQISSDNPSAFDPAVATRAWLETVPPDKRTKSDAYFEGGYWLLLWNFLIAAAIFIFLLQSRLSARLRDIAERLTKFKSVQVALYTIGFVLITSILSFPLNVYQNFVREHQYGFATQTFGPWFAEQIKALGITLIALSIALVILYAVLRRASRTWWIWASIVAVGLNIVGSFIAPLYIEPVFNTYKPLQDPAIRDPILAMARANEIPVKQVFVVDASRQTTRVSANVAGVFGTTRIALNDNLLNQCTLPEIRAVMAHEMGHYILNHTLKLVVAQGLQYLVVFALTARFFTAAGNRWGDRWGVRGIGDPAGLPLLALILSVLFFILTPVTNTVIRVTEREADAFGINTAREPDAAAKIALKLGAYRKLDPCPIEELIFFDHPSGRARIRMAMDWKAAQLPSGEVNR
jgi:STE24 endopeptidase